MLYCNKCKIKITTLSERCPLCHQSLHAGEATGTNDALTQAALDGQPVKRRYYLTAGSAAAIVLAVLSVATNLLIWKGPLWCTVFSAGVLYAWFLGRLSFNPKITIGKKLIAHAAAITALLFLINLFAQDFKTVSRDLWAVSYAVPIVFTSFIIAVSIVMLIWKQQLRNLLFYQFGFCIVCLVPLVLVLFGLAQPLLPSLISAGSALITGITVVFVARPTIKAEFVRKFHL